MGQFSKTAKPGYKGTYPELVVFHGGLDPVVSTNNANQLIKQWVNIHNTDYEEDEHYPHFRNNEDIELTVYKNKEDKEIVRYYRVRGMGHAVAIDTGDCNMQGGKSGLFAVDKDFHSTFWAAHFFGLIKQPYEIEGPAKIKPGTDNLNYSVLYHEGSTYKWSCPAGFWVTQGKNTSAITASADYESGYLEVTEILANGCSLEPCRLWIEVKN